MRDIDRDRADIVRISLLQGHLPTGRPFQQPHLIGNDSLDVDGFRLEGMLAAEGQEATRQLGAGERGGQRGLDQVKLRRACRGRILQQIEIANDDQEQVVEVMSNAAGELADRIQLLGLHQPPFHCDPIPLGALLLRDVLVRGNPAATGHWAAGDGDQAPIGKLVEPA